MTVTIVYNFTENPISERITNDTTNSIIKRSEQVALNKKVCSTILPSLPPQYKNTNTGQIRCSCFYTRYFDNISDAFLYFSHRFFVLSSIMLNLVISLLCFKSAIFTFLATGFVAIFPTYFN